MRLFTCGRLCSIAFITESSAAACSPRCSSIICAAEIAPTWIGDALPGDVGSRAVHRLEQEGKCFSGLMLPDGAMPKVPVQAGPEIEQDIAKEVRTDEHIEARWVQHELGGERVHVELVHLHSG